MLFLGDVSGSSAWWTVEFYFHYFCADLCKVLSPHALFPVIRNSNGLGQVAAWSLFVQRHLWRGRTRYNHTFLWWRYDWALVCVRLEMLIFRNMILKWIKIVRSVDKVSHRSKAWNIGGNCLSARCVTLWRGAPQSPSIAVSKLSGASWGTRLQRSAWGSPNPAQGS